MSDKISERRGHHRKGAIQRPSPGQQRGAFLLKPIKPERKGQAKRKGDWAENQHQHGHAQRPRPIEDGKNAGLRGTYR